MQLLLRSFSPEISDQYDHYLQRTLHSTYCGPQAGTFLPSAVVSKPLESHSWTSAHLEPAWQ